MRRAFSRLLIPVALAACGRAQPPAPYEPPIAPALLQPDSAAAPVASSAPSASSAPAAGLSADSGAVLSLPKEPWYHDRPERFDDCVTPPAKRFDPHFPAPFDACDPRSESYTSPPQGGSLHFHYRNFSVAVTTAQRATRPGVCCYVIYEFPRRSQSSD